MERYLLAALVGSSTGVIAYLGYMLVRMLLRPLTRCPCCSHVLPRVQIITAQRRKRLGIPAMGWHCLSCQAVIDQDGKVAGHRVGRGQRMTPR